MSRLSTAADITGADAAVSAAHFEDIIVCINEFAQFLYVPHDVRLFSLLLNERFAFGLGL